MEKHVLLKNEIKEKQIKYNHHDALTSVLEAVLARGDRRVANLIYEAYRLGAKFDSWSEHFKFESWEEASKKTNVDFAFYANRERSYEEVLPWDHIDIGVSKAFLIRESKLSKQAQTTPNCFEKCSGCGANRFKEGICHENKM